MRIIIRHLRPFTIVACLIALTAILLMTLPQKPPSPEPSLADFKDPSSPVAAAPPSKTKTSAPGNASADVEPNEIAFKTIEVGERGPVAFKVTKRGALETLQIHIGGFELNETPDGWIPSLEGSDGIIASSIRGVPELPRIVRYFPGRDGFTAEATVTETDWADVNDVDLAPAKSLYRQGDEEDGETWIPRRQADDFVFSQDAFWPSSIIDVQEIRMRNRHLVRVEVRPLQYNPVTGVIRHHKDIAADLAYAKKPETIQAFNFASSATEVADNCDCSERFTKEIDLFPEFSGEAANFASRWPGAEANACVKIRIPSQGIWRLTRSELIAAGVTSTNLVGSQIRMFTRDREIPIFVSTQGTLGASDYIDFYGEGFQGFHADQNAYWLGFGGPGTPARFSDDAVSNDGSTFNAPTLPGASTAGSACRQITYNPKTTWLPNLNVGPLSNRPPYHLEYDGYMAGALRNFSNLLDTITYTFQGTDNLATPANARMRVAVNGFANRDHDLGVLNTTDNASNATDPFSFFGNNDVYEQIEKPLPSNILSEPSSTLEFVSLSADDWFYLDWAKLRFDRRLVATENQLAFGGLVGSFNYDVSGFTPGATPYILDITDPTHPLQLNADISGSSLRFGRNLPYEACYFVAGASAIKPVPQSAISAETIHNLADDRRQADYIVIIPEIFDNDTVYDLLSYRAEQLLRDDSRDSDRRMSVLVATTQSIYNEFGWGIESADAIKQFLGYAYHHFQEPKPKYIVLAGDATRDPLKVTQEYQTGGWTDYVPAKFGSTSFVYASIEQWYAAVDGADNCADMAIGRLPVNNDQELQTVINKMKAYEGYTPSSMGWRRNATLIADQSPNIFNDCSTGIVNTCYDAMNNAIAALPNQQDLIFTRGFVDVETTFEIRAIIRNAFNDGAFFINYFGASSLNEWGFRANEQFLYQQLLDDLNNTRFPLVTAFGNSFGNFYSPDSNDSGSELLVRRNSGAAGVIALSGLGTDVINRTFGLQFYDSMFNNVALQHQKDDLVANASELTTVSRDITRVGDCLLESFLATALLNGGENQELKFINMFMDPAMHHNRTTGPRIDPP